MTGTRRNTARDPERQGGEAGGAGRLPDRKAAWSDVRGMVMSAGARTPEELETLFEDALVMRDREALAELFEAGAVLLAGDGPPTRGGKAIARLSLATWDGDRAYVADPRHVIQARDLALIVAEQGVNVARRGRDGDWRYVIVRLSVEDGSERRKQ